jgi:23S rRNA (guanosine2251-2'-O)-methyltransferase
MFVYGIHSVNALIQQNKTTVFEFYLNKNNSSESTQKIENFAKKQNITIKRVSQQQLNTLSNNGNHQGVVALINQIENKGEQELAEFLEKKENPLIAIFEHIQDPRNLGACLRSVQAVDVDCVILTKNISAPINELVYKTSAGAVSSLNIFQVPNMARTLKKLQKSGVWLVGLDGYSTQNIYQSQLTGSMGLVIGSEGSGLKKQTKEICDELVSIPMSDKLESLNVSVATGVTFFEAQRQRNNVK